MASKKPGSDRSWPPLPLGSCVWTSNYRAPPISGSSSSSNSNRDHIGMSKKKISPDLSINGAATAKKRLNKLKPRFKRKQEELGFAEIIPSCSECGKSFPSSKALFGHMRCHPERNWRGINPPPSRRRAVILPPSPPPPGEGQPIEKELEVAEILMVFKSKPVVFGRGEYSAMASNEGETVIAVMASNEGEKGIAVMASNEGETGIGINNSSSSCPSAWPLDLNVEPAAVEDEDLINEPQLDLRLGI